MVVESLAWFSEKHCLLMARSEGSFSLALISDLLPDGVLVVVAAGADDPVAVVVGVGVCASPLLVLLVAGFLSLSSGPGGSSSLDSCWYISSTMGFHNRTLALMNQFDT
ncbi:hypothetical protein OIU76_002209 [Salix suchowensis]|nr:hypothetical protein OIU78_020470 [Salix suchowensis]KAJ6353153.1 hypothetical protein OIU76_002209 [Salix suchowensis]